MPDDEPLDVRTFRREQNPQESQPIAVAPAHPVIEDNAAAEVLERRADIGHAATHIAVVQLRARDPLVVLGDVPPDDAQRLGAIAEPLAELIEWVQPSPPARD